MYKIKTLTFHHAHNFGSSLQTYALQEYIKSIAKERNVEIEYQIVDFYTSFQEEFYSVLKTGINVKNIIKNIFALAYLKELNVKHEKFEGFLRKRCNLSKRYMTEKEMKETNFEADCFISGSDQIWNVRALDFSDIYYLNFISDVKKISYAASLGPLMIDWKQYDEEKYQKYLDEFNYISVREKGSVQNIDKLLRKNCEINVDPTLLLSKKEWQEIQTNVNYNNGKYILMYCLEPSKKQIKLANQISKKLNLPIVVLRYNNKNDMINTFVKKYDSGPEDFLSYIDNAALILTSSFHGTVFSLIYEKPFYVFDGLKDNRISNILINCDLEDRSLESDEINHISLELPKFAKKVEYINSEKNKSKNYLLNALNYFNLENK